MDGWMDGRMDGRTDGRTDGWMDVHIYIYIYKNKSICLHVFSRLFLLVFGLPPLVHPDDPARAVLASMELVQAEFFGASSSFCKGSKLLVFMVFTICSFQGFYFCFEGARVGVALGCGALWVLKP